MSSYYHLSVKMISRGDGKSVVASSAYRSGMSLQDLRYGKQHDYGPRRGILETGIIAPGQAPHWALDREKLWNHVEALERRKDAQLAREFTLGLPHQVDGGERRAMVDQFVREQLLPRGMIVDYAIHAPNRAGDDRNHHAHLLCTLRPLEDGELSSKKDREACTRQMVQQWREAWAEIQNHTFERLQIKDERGQILRVDHRSYKAQGLEMEPTQHMGPLATAMERDGKATDIGEKNRAILEGNRGRHKLREQAREILQEVHALEVLQAINAHRELDQLLAQNQRDHGDLQP